MSNNHCTRDPLFLLTIVLPFSESICSSRIGGTTIPSTGVPSVTSLCKLLVWTAAFPHAECPSPGEQGFPSPPDTFPLRRVTKPDQPIPPEVENDPLLSSRNRHREAKRREPSSHSYPDSIVRQHPHWRTDGLTRLEFKRGVVPRSSAGQAVA